LKDDGNKGIEKLPRFTAKWRSPTQKGGRGEKRQDWLKNLYQQGGKGPGGERPELLLTFSPQEGERAEDDEEVSFGDERPRHRELARGKKNQDGKRENEPSPASGRQPEKRAIKHSSKKERKGGVGTASVFNPREGD